MPEKLMVKQLSSLQCLELVQRFSGQMFLDTSTESRRLLIVDVRAPHEYGSGHLKGSINLDFRSPSFGSQIEGLDRDDAYLLYCRTGIRSARALLLMSSLGFLELYNLTKGIEQWKREGYEVVLDSNPKSKII